MFEVIEHETKDAVIKVVGVGGGGGNAVKHMIKRGARGVEFICANTDAQALRSLQADTLHAGTLLQLGDGVTRGLGAGADPVIGKDAAHEDLDKIEEALSGADMVFIAAGMGGGTGTGAAPVVAEIAHNMGILTVAVVTKPFLIEGKGRMAVAEQGILELVQHVDSLITIPNEKLLSVLEDDTTLKDAFGEVDNVLTDAVSGIADLIIRPGLINVDFADVRTVMREMGMAMMGNGRASGPDRARQAAESAIRSPLLENVDITDARGILINVAASHEIKMKEYMEAITTVQECASGGATSVIGTAIDESLGDELQVTLVATGLASPLSSPSRLPLPATMPAPPSGETARKATVDSVPNYRSFDRPTVIRQSKDSDDATALGGDNPDYLDIPAFLRRQAD